MVSSVDSLIGPLPQRGKVARESGWPLRPSFCGQPDWSTATARESPQGKWLAPSSFVLPGKAGKWLAPSSYFVLNLLSERKPLFQRKRESGWPLRPAPSSLWSALLWNSLLVQLSHRESPRREVAGPFVLRPTRESGKVAGPFVHCHSDGKVARETVGAPSSFVLPGKAGKWLAPFVTFRPTRESGIKWLAPSFYLSKLPPPMCGWALLSSAVQGAGVKGGTTRRKGGEDRLSLGQASCLTHGHLFLRGQAGKPDLRQELSARGVAMKRLE